MTEIIRPHKQEKELTEAIRALKHGKAVVYPTDTAYGLGVDATNLEAVKLLYKIKERIARQPVHIVVSGMPMARKYILFNKTAKKLYEKFMPGALTLVLPLKKDVPLAIKELSAGTGTLGVREPDNRTAIALAKKLHAPITTTSANPSAHKSGGTTPYSVEDARRQFESKRYKPVVYLDGGPLPPGRLSTIVSVINGHVVIIRAGAITKNQINKILKQTK